VSPLYRPSSCRSPAINLAKTLAQTVVFWSVFLWLIPAALIAGTESAAPPRFEPLSIGWGVFAAGGALGLWSGFTMAVTGRGTPLPTDTAQQLVVTGPYRWIRNPMAAGGIAQGVGVGLMTGSWVVIVYALCGAVVWHMLVRPSEERDLVNRFGPPYKRYRAAVRCWRFRLTPFRER